MALLEFHILLLALLLTIPSLLIIPVLVTNCLLKLISFNLLFQLFILVIRIQFTAVQ